MVDQSEHYDKLMAQGKRAEADAFADAHPTDANWPTSEQFDTAGQHGTEYALQEIQNGNDGPQESPLSGEWADGIINRDVASNVGYVNDATEEDFETYNDAINALADAWEISYNDTWRIHTEGVGTVVGL